MTEAEHVCPECGWHDRHEAHWWVPGQPLVTIIGFWPVEEHGLRGYDNRWISRCHYRTACAHAHWNLQIVESPDQIILPPGIPVIGLEEPYPIDDSDREGHSSDKMASREVIEMIDFAHPINATYIMGNTFYQRPSEHVHCDHLIGITMDDVEIAAYSPLYGSQLATMIWYDRKFKEKIESLDSEE